MKLPLLASSAAALVILSALPRVASADDAKLAPMLPAPTPMPADAPPSTGVGLTVAGGAIAFAGVAGAALTVPVCKLDIGGAQTKSAYDACVAGSLISSGIFVAVGTPLLVVGIRKVSAYRAWRAEHPVLAGFDVKPNAGGASVGFTASF